MTRDEAIARLKQSEADLKKAGVKHLYLFGSTIRSGNLKPYCHSRESGNPWCRQC